VRDGVFSWQQFAASAATAAMAMVAMVAVVVIVTVAAGEMEVVTALAALCDEIATTVAIAEEATTKEATKATATTAITFLRLTGSLFSQTEMATNLTARQHIRRTTHQQGLFVSVALLEIQCR
jgi:hypothetical protein